MRLIDADVYEKILTEWMPDHQGEDDIENAVGRLLYDCIAQLHEMPTISPESILPQGLWIENNDEYDNYHYCSNCEKRAPNHKGDGLIIEEVPDYCPYCGAHMMGELYFGD